MRTSNSVIRGGALVAVFAAVAPGGYAAAQKLGEETDSAGAAASAVVVPPFVIDETVTLSDGTVARLQGPLTLELTPTTTTTTTTTTEPPPTTTTTETQPPPPPASRYVSVGGSDANQCSQASPCASFQRAYAVASPGDVVSVAAGTYGAQTFALIAGRAGPPVVFKPSGSVTVAGGVTSGKAGGSITTATGAAHVELADMTVQGEVTLRWGSNDWTLRNVTARNIRIQSVSDVQVLGGSYGPFTDQVATINSAGGSSPGVNNILIDGVAFHDYTISDPAKHAECMQIWPGAASSNVTIRNSSFRNCTDFGVLVKAANLTNMVFDTVTLDEPMPGNEATVACNPDCPRGGSSIRFSTHPYPGAKVIDSRMAGSLAIDVPGYVTVTGGCTRCDPGEAVG